jgi:integrase
VRYYEPGEGNRKRVQKFLGSYEKLTKPQAKKAMREVLAVVNENVAVLSETETTTFREYADRWIEDCETRKKKPIKDSVSRDWRSILKNHLDGPIGDLPLSDVGNRTMKSLVERLSRKKLAPATIRNICLVVKLVKASAIDEDGNQLFPERWNSRFIDAPTVDPTKQRRPTFTAEQVSAIVRTATGRLQMAAILFASSGLRAGELLGLEVRHFDGTSITVNQAVWGPGQVQGPKTQNAYRTVDLHPSVSALLKQFIGKRTSGFIFRASSGGPLTQANFLRRELHPLLESLEIPMRGFHSFRRFRNTFLRQSHCPDGLLKFWMGHAGASMSDTYDRSREDVRYRQDVAKAMGFGFDLPVALTAKCKREKSSQSDVISLIGRQEETVISG